MSDTNMSVSEESEKSSEVVSDEEPEKDSDKEVTGRDSGSEVTENSAKRIKIKKRFSKNKANIQASFMKLNMQGKVDIEEEIKTIIAASNQQGIGQKYPFQEVVSLQFPANTYNFETKLYERVVASPAPLSKAYGVTTSNVKASVAEICFYYRAKQCNTLKGDKFEAFAVTTGHGYEAILPFADYQFVQKIAEVLFSEDGMHSDATRPLIGMDIKKTRTSKAKSVPLFSDYSFLLSYETSLRPNSSIIELGCLKENASVKAGAARLRFSQKLSLCDIYNILNHFAKIINGETTYYFQPDEGVKKVEKPNPNAHKSIATVIPNHKIQGNESVYKHLNGQLLQRLKSFRLDKSAKLELQEMEFYHKHVDDYMSGSDYRLVLRDETPWKEWQTRPTLLDVCGQISDYASTKTIKSKKGGYHQSISFSKAMDSLRFWFKKPSRHIYTKDKIISYIQGGIMTKLYSAVSNSEITKMRWKINNQWCDISDDALLRIEVEFVAKIKQCLIHKDKIGYLSKPYAKDKNAISQKPKSKKENGDSARNKYEEIYNYSFLGQRGFFVGDQIEDKNIEYFDLLYCHDEKSFLYHVKEKFGQNTRNAASQLRVSLILALRNIVLGTDLQNYYNSLKDLNGPAFLAKFSTVDSFRKCLNSATFVYAFTDSNKNPNGYSFHNEISRPFEIDFDAMPTTLDEKFKAALIRNYSSQELVIKIHEAVSKFKNQLLELGYIRNYPSGQITGKLLYETGAEFSRLFGGKNKNTANTLWEILKPYKTNYSSLLAKLELIELANFCSARGKRFKICQIPFKDTNNLSTDDTAPGYSNTNTDLTQEKMDVDDDGMDVDFSTSCPSQRYGIPNFGNTCYQNASIQLLLEFPQFSNLSDLEGIDATVKPWITEMINFTQTRRTFAESQHSTMQHPTPKMLLSQKDDRNTQQDASEFLNCIVNNSKTLKSLLKYTFNIGNRRLEEDYTFKIAVPSNLKENSTSELFKFYLHGSGNPEESIKIHTYPEYVNMNLKIYDFTLSTGSQKIHSNQINISPEISFTVANEGSLIYELVGMICHIGKQVHGGHYVYVVPTENEKWLEYNDDNLPQEHISLPTDRDPYVILYRMKSQQQA